MNHLELILASLAILSLVLLLWQWFVARFFPLHRRTANPDFSPPISILKPLKGCDDTTVASLQSWFRQKYNGPIQLLFGVADPDDPVCLIVKQLIAENPNSGAQLLICAEILGPSGKVSTLAQLEMHVKYDLILISDQDVRVPSDLLENLVIPMREEGKAGSPNSPPSKTSRLSGKPSQTKDEPLLSPLPGGEGQGEGERSLSFQISTLGFWIL